MQCNTAIYKARIQQKQINYLINYLLHSRLSTNVSQQTIIPWQL